MHRFFAGLAKSGPSGKTSKTSSSGAIPERDGFHVFEGRRIVVDLATQLRVEGREQRFEGRDWLEEQLRYRRPLGFDMEWRPDRQKDSDNPVALIQLADADTALLLRTHETGRWLPQLVLDVLTCPSLKKICVGYDGSDRRKLESSFGIALSGVVDLCELGPRRGLQHTGLKHLAEDLGWKMRKESRVARSDWMAASLTDEQAQYAAEDAYFTYKIFVELEGRPETAPEEAGNQGEDLQSALSMKPGWAEQGVVRRHDGLYCEVCKKGPMLHADVMVRHLESRNHVKKMQSPDLDAAPAAEVPEDLAARGIACGSPSHPRALPGEYLCTVCDAGPFQNLDGARAHLRGRQHLKNEQKSQGAEPEELPADLEAAGIEPCDEPGSFRCSLCDAGPFSDMTSAYRHVAGRQHQRRCTPPPAEGAEAAPPAAAAAQPAARSGIQPEDLDILPGYVDLWEGELMCSLCVAKANNLQNMIQHLCSEKHSKVCRKSGKAELIWVQDLGRLEEFETGRPVDREDEIFDEDFLPPPRPVAARPPSPSTAAPPDGTEESLAGSAPPSALQRARSSSEGRKRVHFDDEAPPARKLEAPAQPQPKDLATAKAWSCWSGRAKKASCDPRRSLGLDEPNTQGKSLVARVDVTPPPPGWVWDASTCLAVSRGESVDVLEVEGGWVYGRCGARSGWLPPWALGQRVGEAMDGFADALAAVEGDSEARDPVHVGPWTDAGTGGSAAAVDLRGRTLRARADVGVPADWSWDPSSYLRLAAGEDFEVLAGDGEWLYARSGAREGWLQLSAVSPAPELGDADGSDSAEVPASSGEAACGDAGGIGSRAPGARGSAAVREDLSTMHPASLRQRLEEVGVAVPPGVLEKSELVELLRTAEGGGEEEAARVADNDSEASTAPSSTSLGDQDEHGAEGPDRHAVRSQTAVGAGVDDVILLKGHLARAREPAAGAPEGFNRQQFLELDVGDEVMPQYIHSGWAWARAAHRSGWVRTSVLGDRCESAVVGSPQGSVKGAEGSLVRVQRDVAAPTDRTDAGTFLVLAEGDALLVEYVMDSLVWSFAGGRSGWAPASALCAPTVDVGAQRAGAPRFKLRALRRVVGPPEGMDGANFLLLELGDEVLVEHVGDDGWLWGSVGDACGWAPSWAFDLSDDSHAKGCTAHEQPAVGALPPQGCLGQAAVACVAVAAC